MRQDRAWRATGSQQQSVTEACQSDQTLPLMGKGGHARLDYGFYIDVILQSRNYHSNTDG